MSTHVAKNNAFFNNLFETHGKTPKGLGWSEQGQMKRFQVVEELMPDQFSSLLDVGCGFGDFYAFLQKKRPNHAFEYEGYDINPGFVKTACSAFPGRIKLHDFIEDEVCEEEFDVVVSIGAFNIRVEDNVGMLKRAIVNSIRTARNVALISAQSVYADQFAKDEHPYTYFYDPEEMFSFAKTLVRNVDLIHSYMPHDFILRIYK